MGRLSLLALVSFVPFCAVFATPQQNAVGGVSSWRWAHCGAWNFASRDPARVTHLRRHVGHSSDPVTIKSLSMFPDPPEPGRKPNLTIDVHVSEPVKASVPGRYFGQNRLTLLFRKVHMLTLPSSGTRPHCGSRSWTFAVGRTSIILTPGSVRRPF